VANNASHESRLAMDGEPQLSERVGGQYLRTVVLTNTRQAGRFSSYVPDHRPNPALEYLYLRENGIDQHLRDRMRFPLNPLERLDILYAGIDPLRALSVLVRDRHVDAVLCVYENTAPVIVALRRAFRFGAPVFLWEVSERGWRPRDAILDFVVPRVDQVLTLTIASKRYVESAYNLKRPAIVVGYAVDETFFRPDAEASCRAYPGGDYILAVGDDQTRDYDVLLEACASVDVSLVIRTGLPLRIPPQLGEKVKVIANQLSYRELRDLYRHARLVALPLRDADNPGGVTTLFEGMAMAKPIVCSDTGATRDFIVDRENGFLVPPGDAKALRAAVMRVLAHPDQAAAVGIVARRRLEQNFSLRRRSERMAAAIRDTLSLLRGRASR
jgi:glycosyltransferase involved in cell wall biosynthesis